MKELDELFYCDQTNDTFYIRYDIIFDKEELFDLTDHNLSAKRNFRNMLPMIKESYEKVFLDENGNIKDELCMPLFKMLNLKVKVMTVNPMMFGEFLSMLKDAIHSGDDALLKAIHTYVDDNYHLTLDEDTKKSIENNKKVNKNLQLTDTHVRAIMETAVLERVCIPFISEYFIYNKNSYKQKDLAETDLDELKTEEALLNLFNELLNLLSGNELAEAIKSKLYLLSSSEVKKCIFNNRVFWAMAKNLNITPETETLAIYNKLISNVIGKLLVGENSVNFIISVIRRQVVFLTQTKFQYHYSIIENNPQYDNPEADNESISEYEYLESANVRIDEGEYLIKKMNINGALKDITNAFNVSVDDYEVKELATKIHRNVLQEQIIALLTFKYFKDNSAIKSLNFYQYCYLLIACKKFLEIHKFKYIPAMLTSKCFIFRDKAGISGKRALPEITNSKKFKELVDGKFKYFKDEVVKPFLSLIGTVYASTFLDLDTDKELFNNIKVTHMADEIISIAEFV